MGKGILPFVFFIFAAPLVASAFEPNLVIGYGRVGRHQLGPGGYHGVITVNLTGFVRVTDSLSLGGLGLALRGGHAFFKEADEFGLAVPFATYRKGTFVAQTGVQLQSTKTYFFWFGLGVTMRRWAR